MTILKCKMCGGSIEAAPDKTYGTCDSCGNTMTLPKVSDEQRANLFNRANHFRRQNEFDKAVAAYERILDEDNADAEAHWGVVLSRFGIEYVEDPVSHERIPTCHRVQSASILTDADYLAALENASDSYTRELYEKEAHRIADIQKGILAISSQEDPYDVFICYKESTDGGVRTRDSALAQDIYYQLTQNGYKVFFSRISLESKLGQQYEPYIFAALNSARVMLVVGTKPEHFSAVWVKNEWSRYLALMKQDRSRLLIPCYRDMDPYDLPEELSALQSQDMGKIGFMQDLLHGVQKVLEGQPEGKASASAVQAPGVASLLKRARLFLEDGDFASADEYAEKVLDIDPECAAAYIVKTMVARMLHSEEELGEGTETLTTDSYYAKALRFAVGQQKETYQAYEDRIQENIREADRAASYQHASSLLESARSEQNFLTAAEIFEGLGEYRDAQVKARHCKQRAEDARILAQRTAEAQAAERAQREQERQRQEERQRIQREKEAKRTRRRMAVIAGVAAVLIALAATTKLYILPKMDYNQAVDLLEAQQYDEAIAALQAMNGWGESQQTLAEAYYQKALSMMEGGDYLSAQRCFADADALGHAEAATAMQSLSRYLQANDMEQSDPAQAAAIYAELGDFLDSSQRYAAYCASTYQAACDHYAAGNFQQAYDLFLQLGDYSDSAERVAQLDAEYQTAQSLLAEGKTQDAAAAFARLGDFSQSETYAEESRYQHAQQQLNDGRYDEAIQQFEALGNYSDSADQVMKASYAKALNADDPLAAEALFEALGDYSDAPAQLEKVRRAIASNALEKLDYAQALAYMLKLPQTDGLKAREYQLAQDAYESEAYAQAVQAYEALGQYELSLSKLPIARYAYAQQLYAAKQYLEAAEQFAMLGDFTDSAEKARQSLYLHAKSQMANADYTGAKETLASIADYQDAPTLSMECDYQLALADMNAGRYNAASARFAALNDYADSKAQRQACQYAAAEQLLAESDYAAAQEGFAELASYQDSAERLNYCIYMRAKQAFDAKDFISAAALYGSIPEYLDSAGLAKESTLQSAMEQYRQGNYGDAISLLNGLNHGDSEQLKAQCYCELGKQALAQGERQSAVLLYEQALILPEAQQMLYTIGKDYASINQNELALETLFMVADYEPARELLTEMAQLLQAKQQPEAAIIAHLILQAEQTDAAFSALFEATPPEEVLKKIQAFTLHSTQEAFRTPMAYRYAQILLARGRYAEASAAFAGQGSYQDAAKLVKETCYKYAEVLLADGRYDDAAAAFAQAGDYQDAAVRVNEPSYRRAEALLAEGKYDEAAAAFAQAGDYQDAAERVNEPSYRRAEALLAEGKYDEAIAAFASLGNYLDAADRVKEAYYQYAEVLLADGKYDEATAAFAQAGDYQDAANRVKEASYKYAEALLAAGKPAAARLAFHKAGDYEDSREQEAKLTRGPSSQVAAGGSHTVGLNADGAVVAVGYNDDGQCDVRGWSDIVSVAAGTLHTVGLKADGTVVAVGYNDDGQCYVSGWSDIVSVAAGTFHTVGLKADGTVVAVGYNGIGQCNVGGWSDIVAIAAGERHTVGLKADGTVVSVGDNVYGQCVVSGWSDIVAIAAGERHTVGLKADGTVVSVGDNYYGQCVVSGWSDIVAVAAGAFNTVGLKADGTVVAVGSNSDGRCDVRGWSDIVAVVAGGSQTVGLKADGTVVAVGYNGNGQCDVSGWRFEPLGASAMPDSSSSGLSDDTLTEKAGLAVQRLAAYVDQRARQSGGAIPSATQIATGSCHTVGLRADGTVVATGDNHYRQCDVSGWKDIVAVAAGWYYTVGLKVDGTVVAVGDNDYAQCDVGRWTDIVAIAAASKHTVGLRRDGTVVAIGENEDHQCYVSDWSGIVAISAGKSHTVGLRANGTVLATGSNELGQCDVTEWTDIVAISAHDCHTVGLRADGTVVATGDNNHGQCDVSGWRDIVAISAGGSRTLGLKADGTVVVVGQTTYGLGKVDGWKNIVAISAGGFQNVGVQADGAVVAVGSNSFGECKVKKWRLEPLILSARSGASAATYLNQLMPRFENALSQLSDGLPRLLPKGVYTISGMSGAIAGTVYIDFDARTLQITGDGQAAMYAFDPANEDAFRLSAAFLLSILDGTGGLNESGVAVYGVVGGRAEAFAADQARSIAAAFQ